MMFKTGSIIVYRDKSVHTISVIDVVKGQELYCKQSICSKDGGKTYVSTKQYLKDYEGENVTDGIRLCNNEEFDIVLDTGIIPRDNLIDVE